MAERHRFVVWLDRDGTLVDDPGYLDDPDALVLFDGVVEAMAALRAAAALTVLITNQSGIARGYMPRETVDSIHARLQEKLGEGRLDHIELCPHWPADQLPDGEAPCDCRKPQPGMILRARDTLGLQARTLPEIVVGDKLSDLQLAAEVGAHAVLVRTGDGRATEAQLTPQTEVDCVADDLGAAVRWILETFAAADA